jgi:hypothetical protein
MTNAYKMLLASAIALPLAVAPAIALAQHTGPGAPMRQGDQLQPGTTVAPRGSAPEADAMSASDLQGLDVVNEFGEPVGQVDRVVQGDAGRVYVVVSLGDGRPVVFPIMLMGIHQENLVVQGYGEDILRAQTLEPNALAGFNPVHPAEVVEIPQVNIAQQ